MLVLDNDARSDNPQIGTLTKHLASYRRRRFVRKGRKGRKGKQKRDACGMRPFYPFVALALFAFFASFADKKQSAGSQPSLLREQAHR
jgi:hypothetical protein